MPEPFLTGKRLVRFEALQHALVPRSRGLSDAGRAESRRLVNDLIGNRAPADQRRLALFLWIIDLVSFLVGLRPFRRLPAARQRRVLAWFFDNPIPLLRKGFWGLNTMAKLGVYGQPAVHDEIGYELRENPAT